MSRADAMERVQRLLAAGVTSFIDLTEEGELPEYEKLLPELTERRVRYRRLPVLDHSVPDSPAHMARILDLIDSELARGPVRVPALPCGHRPHRDRVGCHLVRSGLTNDAGVRRLQVLWKQCARSRRWPSIPETSEQVDFVLRWREPGSGRGRAARTRAALRRSARRARARRRARHAGRAEQVRCSTLVAAMRERSSLRTGAHTAMTRARRGKSAGLVRAQSGRPDAALSAMDAHCRCASCPPS